VSPLGNTRVTQGEGREKDPYSGGVSKEKVLLKKRFPRGSLQGGENYGFRKPPPKWGGGN